MDENHYLQGAQAIFIVYSFRCIVTFVSTA